MSRALPSVVAIILLLSGPPARAAIEVEISGVSGELLANVEAYLDLRKRAQDTDLSESAIYRLYAAAEASIRRAMRPFGYYDITIRSELVSYGDDWRARFDIEAGPRVVVEQVDVRIDGEGASAREFATALEGTDLRPGAPLFHPDYDRLKAELERVAAKFGYFDAQFRRHELIVDAQKLQAFVYLHLDTGPRYRFGAIRIKQDFLHDFAVLRVIELHEGEYFDGGRLSDSEFALYATGYFSTVDIVTTPNPETREVPLTFTMTPTRKHRWTAGGGFSTDTQLYLKGSWRNRIANRRGHSMGVDLRVSQVKLDMLYRYVIPSGQPSEKITLLGGLVREERGDTRSNRLEIAAVDSRQWRDWQRDFLVTAQAEKSDLAAFEFTDFWAIPGVRLIRGRWNDITRPTRGSKLTGQLRGSAGALGAPTDYLQLQLRSAWYLPVRENLRFYLRGEVGATAVVSFEDLPVSQRYFAGGDRSVRGFALNELGPVDDAGNRVGGKHLLFASAELEYDFRERWTLAVFADAGNAFDRFGDPLEYSAGIGLRWRSPLGLIGADIGQALSEDGLKPRLHFTVRPEL